jgi:hypothetical protein
MPDEKKLYDALREGGASEDSAYTAVQEVHEMAAQNITATLDGHKAEISSALEGHKAELSVALAANQAATDSLRAELNAKIDAQVAKSDSTRWMMGALLALLATLTALGLLNTILGLAKS